MVETDGLDPRPLQLLRLDQVTAPAVSLMSSSARRTILPSLRALRMTSSLVLASSGYAEPFEIAPEKLIPPERGTDFVGHYEGFFPRATSSWAARKTQQVSSSLTPRVPQGPTRDLVPRDTAETKDSRHDQHVQRVGEDQRHYHHVR